MSAISRNKPEPIPLGLGPEEVKLHPYSPLWPTLYVEELDRLKANLSNTKIHIEHIGSTAVPGMFAKPVIDIMIGFDDPDLEGPTAQALVNLGYEFQGEKGVPERLFLTLGNPRVYHAHLTTYGSSFWHEHLLFVDELKANQESAEQYKSIKLALAKKFPHNRQAYTDGKSTVIETILNRARKRA